MFGELNGRNLIIFIIIIVVVFCAIAFSAGLTAAVISGVIGTLVFYVLQQRDGMVAAKADKEKPLAEKSASDLIREINAEASSREKEPTDDMMISEPLQYIMRTDGFTGGLSDGTITDVTLGYDNDMTRDANATGIFTDHAQNTMSPQQIRQQLMKDSPYLSGVLSPFSKHAEGMESDPAAESSAVGKSVSSETGSDSIEEDPGADMRGKYLKGYMYGPTPDAKRPMQFDSENYKRYIAGISAAANPRLQYPSKTGGYSGGYEKKKPFDKDFWDTNVDLRSIQANMGGSGDNQIYNRMKYVGMQARIAADARASMNRYTFQPYYDEELRTKENQIWWENDALEEVF